MSVRAQDIKEELLKYNNCTIKQVPMSDCDYIEVKRKVKTRVKKVFNLIPIYEYEIKTKELYIEKHSTMKKTYVYLGTQFTSNIETVYVTVKPIHCIGGIVLIKSFQISI